MLLQNHDILALGRTAAEVFMHLYNLEAACKIQVDVLAAAPNALGSILSRR